MALIQEGSPLDGFTGTVGDVIIYHIYEEQHIKFSSHATKNNKKDLYDPLTALTALAEFFSPLRTLIDQAFYHQAQKNNGYSQCLIYHIKNAIIGEFPNYQIDFSEVVFSRGKLKQPRYLKCGILNTRNLTLAWNSINVLAKKAYIVLFCPSTNQHLVLQQEIEENSIAIDIALPIEFSDTSIHCWICFSTAHDLQFSKSKYLGEIKVA